MYLKFPKGRIRRTLSIWKDLPVMITNKRSTMADKIISLSESFCWVYIRVGPTVSGVDKVYLLLYQQRVKTGRVSRSRKFDLS